MSKLGAPSLSDRTVVAAILAAGGGLVLLRLAALVLDPNSLYPDETQYWLWAQNPDWGYFSKPPLIAWIIAVTTALFGDADWAVRLSAPLLHAATATFLGLTAARLFGTRAGALAGILWMIMPAVWLSSSIISTDAVLMVGWSAGLCAIARLRDGPDWRFAILLGVAAGWAFLAKYAAIYFLLGTGLAILVDAPARRALVSLQGLAAGVIFLALISGNLMWNAANDFATVSHTAANANWGASLFNPDEFITFVVDQFGVFGPITFAALIAAVIAAFKGLSLDLGAARPRLMLALYVAPALLIVAFQAFISRAHANWAASAYAAGTILVAIWFLEGGRWRRAALWTSVGLHCVAGLALMAFAASTPLSDAAGLANAFKRVREWPATVEAVSRAAEEAGVAAIAYDDRNDFHQMQRYGPAGGPELFMWMRYAGAHNFAEATWPLPQGYDQPVLVVSERAQEVPLILDDFERIEPAGEIVIALGGGRERRYRLFLAQGYDPVPRTEEFEARVREMRGG
ncbi:MAG: glycosyltransferase family 39 protein [Alphaproteobacteria bacterium]|nr:glycosyltransferase family 39 protein [Alphaproteobacteria bacterium]